MAPPAARPAPAAAANNPVKPPPQPLAGWRLRQVVADTYQLSKVGGFLYLFGWTVIGWIGGVLTFAPMTAAALAAGFLALAALRVMMRPPDSGDDRAARRWLVRYAVVLPLASVLWSVAQAWVLLDPRFDPDTRMVSLIATIGYATVFANVYSTVRHLAAVGVCVLFVPMLAVLWSQTDARALAVAMSFYALYLAGALMRSHAEYRRRLRLDEALREQRDLFEHLSRTDSLTGLANRRHFTDRLDHAAGRALRGGNGFTLLILDIDHFKRVNDRYGHAVGDTCLQALADRLHRCFPPPACLLARLGGRGVRRPAGGRACGCAGPGRDAAPGPGAAADRMRGAEPAGHRQHRGRRLRTGHPWRRRRALPGGGPGALRRQGPGTQPRAAAGAGGRLIRRTG